MCGRYSLDATPQELVEAFALAEAIAFERRYNIAPTQSVPVVRADPDSLERRASMVQWGMPARGGLRPLINARSETIEQRPSFAAAFRQRRCVVPARGFFEWQKLGTAKQPFHIQRRDGGLLAFAGLWELGGEEVDRPESFVILTTAPNRTMEGIHDRMPAILDRRGWEAWLDPQQPPQRLRDLLGPAPDDLLEAYPISRRVNSTEHDDRSCIEPLARISDTLGEELF